jgi:hypothetical protein
MKIILKYGLLVGVIVGVYMMVEYAIGLHGKYLQYGQYTGYVRYVLLAAGVFIGIRETRGGERTGSIGFWPAVWVGIRISFVAAAVITISELIYIQFVNPGFTDDYVAFTVAKLKTANATVEEINNLLAQAEAWRSTLWQIIFYMGETMLMGAICSLIAAAILKKQKAEN